MAGLTALVVAGTTAATTSGTLPGGSSITVGITSPIDGTTLPLGDVTVNGTASVGEGAPVANTLLIYVMDVSGSTADVQPTSVCGNQNVYDTVANTTLDCELLAVKDLNRAAVTTGTVAQVGAIAFGGGDSGVGALTDAQALDLTGAGGTQQLVAPDSNASLVPPVPAGVPTPQDDVERALVSAYNTSAPTFVPPGWSSAITDDSGFTLFSPKGVQGNTDYWAAVEAIKTLAATSTLSNKIVVFLSDGIANVGPPSGAQSLTVALANLASANVKVFTFGVGPEGECNPAGAPDGTLEEIAELTGAGHCVPLPNPGTAVSVIPAVVASNLTGLSLSVDGSAAPTGPITPTLPVTGPGNASFSTTVSGLAPGLHHLCAQANGTDGGGAGSVQDCVTITIKAPPGVSADGGGTTPEGTAFTLNGTATDGTLTWSATGGSGTCTFADQHAASTTVTCSDDGTYTLTLTADDGINPPTSSSTTLTVTNVPPQVSSPAAPGTIPLGNPVTVSWPFTDPGNDTFSCSIDWGDLTPLDTGTIVGDTCQGTHTYANGGTFNAIATVTDDDGGSGSAAVSILVDAPPVVHANDASGNEGSPVTITGTATDDHGPPSTQWSITSGPGVDPGTTCTIADPSAVTTTVTCTDDGTFTLTLTANDGVNPAVSSTSTLTLANVAPTVTSPAAPPKTPVGHAVTVSWPFTDPGSNDTFTCSINWGDSTPLATGAITGGTCQGTHTYVTGGSFNAIATVTDDDGGSGSASVTIPIDAPPVVHATSASGNEGAAVAITGTATDDDGPPAVTWTITPGPGVDVGTTCSFGNANALATTVTCTDDGTFTLTLTASDGINPPVSSTATLTLANVAPTATITSPHDGDVAAGTVSFSATVADAGTNDVLTCSINWGDGSTTTGTIAGGICTGSHTYGGVTAATITVTVSDDDGGSTQKHVSLSLGAQSLKRYVLTQVNSLLATASKQDRDDLSDASRKLTDALTPSNWIDANHLQSRCGVKVFADEQDAVNDLEDILGNRKSTIDKPTLATLIGMLVQADSLLATMAVSDAAAQGADSHALAKANQYLAKASVALAHGDPDGAIDDYTNAWQAAMDMMNGRGGGGPCSCGFGYGYGFDNGYGYGHDFGHGYEYDFGYGYYGYGFGHNH